MEDSIQLKLRYGGYWRWIFFLSGIFFTYVWVVAKVITDENSGLPISDTARWMQILFFFPMFWGIGFMPHQQVEQLTVDRSGVSTLNSRSKTIFHRRTFSNLFVPAKDVSHIGISEDGEDGSMHVVVWFKTSTGMPVCIALSSHPDIASATEVANKAARLLCCEVKAHDVAETA